MKRLIAFALALAVVFGVSFALYKPERIGENTAQQTDDVWVGYFFSPKDFDGKAYATKTDDGYDFGVPGVPVFVTITPFEPGEPGYEEGSEFNYSVGEAVSDEVVGSGMRVNVDDNGSSYETSGEIALDAQKRVELYECYVYRTPAGDYYAECVLYNGMKSAYCGPGFGLKQTRTISAERSGDWSVSGKTQSHSIKVSVSFVERTAAERLVFAWLRGDKSILSREEYGADALPETLIAPDGASMLVVTQTSADGTSARSLCTQDDLFARAYVPSMLSGLLRVVDVSLDWGKEDF